MISSGNPSSPIWIIGEAPGPEEIARRQPFIGSSGRELTHMLNEAGINRNHCFLGNVADHLESDYFHKATKAKQLGIVKYLGAYPKENVSRCLLKLYELLNEHKPDLIIPLGNLALWATTGQRGIVKWRGSIMETLNFEKELQNLKLMDIQ